MMMMMDDDDDKKAILDSRSYFFSQRSVSGWNNLMQKKVDAPSTNSFKIFLQQRRRRHIDFSGTNRSPIRLSVWTANVSCMQW